MRRISGLASYVTHCLWVAEQGIGVNLPDHDALVGAALGVSPGEFARDLRRLFFCGDADGLASLVSRANAELAA